MISHIENKKILFVTLHYLYGVGGGVFASRAYINAFAEILKCQNALTLLYPTSDSHPIEGIDKRVAALPIYDRDPKWKKLYHLLVGKVHRYFKVFEDIISSRHFDYVVFDNSRVSYRMIDLAHKYGSKVITIHHNCELEYNRDNASSLIKSILLHWTKKYESEAVNKSDISLVLTPEDRTLLIDNYMLPNEVSEKIKILGVFESKQCELPEIKKDSIPSSIKNFIITGNLGAKQSNKSLIEWLNTYYPSLKEIFPNAQLTIAGKNPSAELNEYCKKLNIELIASPPSMHPLLEKADCYICPTSLGGGLKLRIMDGLKYGLPVITHSVSARGYHGFVRQEKVFPYDSLESFISACKKIKDSMVDKEYIQNLYSEIFSFKRGCERLSDILKSYNF